MSSPTSRMFDLWTALPNIFPFQQKIAKARGKCHQLETVQVKKMKNYQHLTLIGRRFNTKQKLRHSRDWITNRDEPSIPVRSNDVCNALDFITVAIKMMITRTNTSQKDNAEPLVWRVSNVVTLSKNTLKPFKLADVIKIIVVSNMVLLHWPIFVSIRNFDDLSTGGASKKAGANRGPCDNDVPRDTGISKDRNACVRMRSVIKRSKGDQVFGSEITHIETTHK